MIADPGLLSSTSLILRSLLWTILLPGFVAGYVPWRFGSQALTSAERVTREQFPCGALPQGLRD